MLNVSGDKSSEKVSVKTSTLDQWCIDENIKPNFIKCDVEGAELLVFQGAKKTLLINKPLIFTELLRKWSKPYNYHPNEMIIFFNKLGYSLFTPELVRIADYTELSGNIFCLHAVKHKEQIKKIFYQ